MFQTAQLSLAQVPPGDDTFEVHHQADRVIIVVADGAGSSKHGRAAAETVVQLARDSVLASTLDAVGLLESCDRVLAAAGHGGETTAVIVILDKKDGVRGASVGDSGAWIVTPTQHLNLTAGQVRKPLVGSGLAVPIPFATGPLKDTLLVATDGLLKYAPLAQRRIASAHQLDEVPTKLIDCVRLRSGALHDDTTVVVCRPRL